MLHNSTIQPKRKICISCGKPCFWFSKKRCAECAKREDSFKRMNENEGASGEDLSSLIQDADSLFSKLVRMSAANSEGIAECFTCGEPLRWQELQCGHYIKRANLFLRWDMRNARPQCKACNEYKHGNMAEYSKRLELEYAGITDILMEESTIIYKPTRDEMKKLIVELNQKLKILLP